MSTKARLGSSKTFTVTVGNDGTVVDSIAVGGPKGADGVKVAYLEGESGAVDITASVVAGTYTLVDLTPGAVATIRMTVTVTPKADVGDRKTFKIRSEEHTSELQSR